ncbi:hypothetical protein B0H19DRAFT_1064525 [Mycena capillaripes]|nr:hypothetical protein B0H19DRAFT_1064525 [Mycena capillaripes]
MFERTATNSGKNTSDKAIRGIQGGIVALVSAGREICFVRGGVAVRLQYRSRDHDAGTSSRRRENSRNKGPNDFAASGGRGDDAAVPRAVVGEEMAARGGLNIVLVAAQYFLNGAKLFRGGEAVEIEDSGTECSIVCVRQETVTISFETTSPKESAKIELF